MIIREQVIRCDRQGLFYGKFDTQRCGTHLREAGSSFCQAAAQADCLWHFTKYTHLRANGDFFLRFYNLFCIITPYTVALSVSL